MTGRVLALSGAIGAGKSKLAQELRTAFDADVVGFGDEVRRYAREIGEDENDRSVLQKLGQAMVLSDCRAFVLKVLEQCPRQLQAGSDELNLIVQGVRHIEALGELKRLVGNRSLHLINVVTPTSLREQRLMDRDKVDRRLIGRYDNDITEAQVARILPQYAHCEVSGDVPVPFQIATIRQRLCIPTGGAVANRSSAA